MNLSTPRPAGHRTRGRGDDGAAVLEFALISILLFTIIFGILNFGFILSFKQDVTRAAAEGARAGAVAVPASTALADARAATDDAVKSFSDRFSADGCFGSSDGVVGTVGLTCSVTLADCGTTNGASALLPDCVTVSLSYDYDHHPLLAPLPLLEPFLPNTITAKSDARVNP